MAPLAPFELQPTLAAKAAAVSISPEHYAFLQRYLYLESGIVIDDDKHYLLESRLNPLLQSHGLESLDMLSRQLAMRPSSPLGQQVVEAMTTNETLFFRDRTMFDALRDQILKPLVEAGRPLRIWSAASSSGQEAYSLAMLLLEMGMESSSVEIVGTDLCEQVLERARRGQYVQFEINRGLPSIYLAKYFERRGLHWQIKDEIRRMVHFERLDLRQNLRHLGTFDLIFCRNVLIYFDLETKHKILDTIRRVLTPEGVLVLGCAETIINVHAGYKRISSGSSTFYQILKSKRELQ